MNIKIIIATHKKYIMPKDAMYLPLQVGAEKNNDIGYQKDNEGINISEKNPNFCELTGLFWAWKNLKADYIGLVHYRRYFTAKKIVPKEENKKIKIIINKKETEKLLNKTDVILPKKRNYFIENLWDHYKHTLYIEPLEKTEQIIKIKYPDYYSEFEKIHKRRKAHMFNMFIMKKEIMDEYCEWLFSILFELEKNEDANKYDKFHARFYGRISELLLDVWINKNKIKYVETKVIDMENVNWVKKGSSFIKAKFLNKKYNKSF